MSSYGFYPHNNLKPMCFACIHYCLYVYVPLEIWLSHFKPIGNLVTDCQKHTETLLILRCPEALKESVSFQHCITNFLTSIVYYQQNTSDNIYSLTVLRICFVQADVFRTCGTVAAVIIAPNMNPPQNPSTKTQFNSVLFCTLLRSAGQQQQQSSWMDNFILCIHLL